MDSAVDAKADLKAVVVADLPDEPFQPLTLSRPHCLLRLCNVPMIEYTLEFLATAGVVETIIMCQAHSEVLLDYIRGSRWSRSTSQMKVVVRGLSADSTLGDALRAVDFSSTVKANFILCTGVAVSNMDLTQLVAAHTVRARDGNHIMTMLLQEATPAHPRWDKCDESVYFIDPATNKLLALCSQAALPRAKSVAIQRKIITDNAEVELRADLMDTNIAICTPDVLALFTENFDYHSMRQDFVSGIIESEDLHSKTIYAHVLSGASNLPTESAASGTASGAHAHGSLHCISQSGYAAGVTDTAAYDAISRDIVGRWAFPLCPDNSPTGDSVYKYSRGAVYKAPSARLDRESRVERHVILGPDSQVANHAYIADSVLGERCLVGEQTTIRASYLFDDTKVGRNAVVDGSILGERVTILDNVVIERGCLIGDDVTIGPNVRIPSFTRVASVPPRRSDEQFSDMSDESDSDSDASSEAADGLHAGRGGQAGAGPGTLASGFDSLSLVDKQVLGASGVGYVWATLSANTGAADASGNSRDNSGSDFGAHDDGAVAERQLCRLRNIGSTLADSAFGDSEQDAESEGDDDDDGEWHVGTKLAAQEEFEAELHLTIKRACDENLAASDAALEIKSLRMSFHKDKDDMLEYLMQEILRTIDVAAPASSTTAVFTKWGPVIKEFIGDGREQLDLLDIVERYFATEEDIDGAARSSLFVRSVCMLYQMDIVEDVAVIAWHGRAQKKPSTEVSPELLRALEPIVDDLNETDESSDGDDSGDDDSGDDSDDDDDEGDSSDSSDA